MTRYGGLAALGLALVAALALLLARSAERGGEPSAATARADPPDPAAAELADESRIERSDPVASSRRAAAEASPGPAAVPPSGSIVLTVLDPERAPIAGARVTVDPGGAAKVLVTDALGTCAWGLPARDVLVEREGFAHRRLANVRRSQVLVLQPATILTGRVVDASTGQPILDAVVEHEHTICAGCDPDRAVTDPSGHYAIGGLAAGTDRRWTFLVRAPGYAGDRFEIVLWDVVPRTERDFELRRRGELHGTVVEMEGGAPIAGARVTVGIDVYAADADGRFSTASTPLLDEQGARSAVRELRVGAKGHGGLSVPLEGLESPVVLPLPRTASVTGRVLVGGAPLQATVSLGNRLYSGERDLRGTPYARFPSWTFVDAAWQNRSGEDGRYRLEGLLPWCSAHQLHVSSHGLPPHVVQVPALEPGQELELDLELVREPGATIHGSLVVNGTASRGRVHWMSEGRAGGFDEVEDGRYRIEHVPAGRVVLEARPLGKSMFTLAPGLRVEVLVAAGQELRHDFRVDLQRATVEGRVIDEDGRPIPDVEVSTNAVAPEHGFQRAMDRTNEVGRYRLLVSASAGALSVSASHEEWEETRSGVLPGSKAVDFVVPRMGTLLCRVLERETGRPVESFTASWRRTRSGADYEPLVLEGPDVDGYFVARVPAGLVDVAAAARLDPLRASGSLQPGLRLAVSVPPDEPARVTFALEPGMEVGFVLEPPEFPVHAHAALLPLERWNEVQCELVNGEGHRTTAGECPPSDRARLFESSTKLSGLAPGRYRFKVFHAKVELEPEVLELHETRREPIVVRWRYR